MPETSDPFSFTMLRNPKHLRQVFLKIPLFVWVSNEETPKEMKTACKEEGFDFISIKTVEKFKIFFMNYSESIILVTDSKHCG